MSSPCGPIVEDTQRPTGQKDPAAAEIADLRAEVDLRQLEWLVSVEQAVLQKPYPQVARALEVWGNRHWTPESCLIKYGYRKYMAELAERGCMRLNPASCYKDPSLNPAIQDSELEFAVQCIGRLTDRQ
jgi:hypothetical protein